IIGDFFPAKEIAYLSNRTHVLTYSSRSYNPNSSVTHWRGIQPWQSPKSDRLHARKTRPSDRPISKGDSAVSSEAAAADVIPALKSVAGFLFDHDWPPSRESQRVSFDTTSMSEDAGKAGDSRTVLIASLSSTRRQVCPRLSE